MDKEDSVRHGREAEQLLKSPAWERAWVTYRAKLFAAIENAKTDEGTIRGKLMLGMVTDVRRILEGEIKGGAYATAGIKLEEERKKRPWPFAA